MPTSKPTSCMLLATGFLLLGLQSPFGAAQAQDKVVKIGGLFPT